MSDTSNNEKPFTQEEFDNLIEESYDKRVEIERIQEENRQINAEIQNKKLKLQQTEMQRISKIQESLEEEDLSERSFDRESMLKDIKDRENAVVFVNDKISEHFIAAPGSLMVIPSMTNNGKSTLASTIAEKLVSGQKRVLVLSNEEKEEDVRARISCLRMGVSFGDYKTNKCSFEEQEKILDDAELLAKNKLLVVISTKNGEDAYMVTTVNGVITTLEKARGKFDAVILDYYTNVNMSEIGVQDPWHVNNKLATELNIFKDSAPFPIICFAQCEGIKSEKKVDNKGQIDYDSNHPMYRWKGGKNILMYATDIIELVKDFDNSCSFLFAHKVRFGHGKLERMHCLPFDKKMQRFVRLTPEWDAKATRDKTIRKTQDDVEKRDLGNIFRKE